MKCQAPSCYLGYEHEHGETCSEYCTVCRGSSKVKPVRSVEITVDLNGEKKVIGHADVHEDGTIEGFIGEAEYIGSFSGYVFGFTIEGDQQ